MGRSIERVIAVYEAGWSGFWLARWLTRHKVEVYVIQPSSVPVDRRMRRAKSDGVVTPGERAHMQHEENQQSRRIYRQKHDAQDRTSRGKFARRCFDSLGIF